MKQTVLKWGAATGIAVGLLFGGALINKTSAQTPQPSQTTPDTQPLKERPKLQNLRNRGNGQRQDGQALKAVLVKQTIDLTKLDRKTVLDQLRGGSSLSAIASANGSSEQAVIDAAIKQLDTRLSAAEQKGRLTAEQKTTMLDEARKAAPGLMQEQGLTTQRGAKNKQAGRHELIKATAEVTGLTVEQVRAELQAGKSLAQIAEAKGKTADDIVANLKAKADAKVAKLLDKAREQINKVPGK